MKKFTELKLKLEPELAAYLDALEIDEQPAPNMGYLSKLYEAISLETVWNNFRVVRRVKIENPLDPKSAFIHAYVKREGGTCLMLNLGFYYIASQLGFKPILLSAFARATEDMEMPGITRESHVVNLITIGDRQYVFDPGWGVNPRKGLLVPQKESQLTGVVSIDNMSSFRIQRPEQASDRYHVQKKCQNGWVTQYDFSLNQRNPEYFIDHLEYVYSDFPYNNVEYCFARRENSVLIYSGSDHIKQIYSNGETKNYNLDDVGKINAFVQCLRLPEQYVREMCVVDDTPVKNVPL